MNREEWLTQAVAKLDPLFTQAGYTLPQVRVSVGWPKGGRKMIGQCWKTVCAKDGIAQVYISPVLDDVVGKQGVLATLVHELLHAVLDCEGGHGAVFKRGMKPLGLEGKATATVAGESLRVKLEAIANEIGPYPHAALTPSSQIKKQGTRLLKVACVSCGYTVRVTRKWVDDVGTPLCPHNHEPMMESSKGEEGEPEEE